MNGAESLVKTLLKGGVDVSFANPGTSEMHYVAALDKIDGMRCVLCLFEGVVTGAADGYARMTGKPAATLLHLGPGLGNALANLHNAKKARSPIVNIVGEHATHHVKYNSPLTSDIEGIARPVSAWVKTSMTADAVGPDGAEAIAAARQAPGQIATLILPADTAWNDGGVVGEVPPIPAPDPISGDAIEAAAEMLQENEPTLILLGGSALMETPLETAARIKAKTGADVMAEGMNTRIQRGVGRLPVIRIPYPVPQALDILKDYRQILLVGAADPVGFFAYPGKPSRLAPDGCRVETLALPEQDCAGALIALSNAVGADSATPELQQPDRPERPTGAITLDSIACAIGALLPENAIVVDESVTTGRGFLPFTAGAGPHDWLQNRGGAIGLGLPMATGAAIACPDRKVICLESDGSGMYCPQAIWTQAREGLDVTTLIFANRSYNILKGELAGVGAGNPGPTAIDMLSLDRPTIDWVGFTRSLGVEATQVDNADDLCTAFERAIAVEGPSLVEVVI
ncbi:MAG: acetolactate synthase large subunit [Rhodospirillaceae bacterium]|nr:acetolactate synthase large subunit [Rhodospirillaceae bacterium]HAA91107.1 acetolactate synthase large subunit [Rhodospirillaceae bacterium]